MSENNLHNLPNVTLVKRLLAALYDWLLVLGLMMVASVPVVALLGKPIDPGNVVYRFSMISLAAAFFIGFWSRGGQTLGMRAWRLRLVTDQNNEPPGPVSLKKSAYRFGAACLSVLPAGMGFWWAVFDRQNLCWHDRLSGTRVIQLPRK